MTDYTQAAQDVVDLAHKAARHATAWRDRDTATREGAAAAYSELAQAVNALSRLVSSAEALKWPLAEELVAHQTDQADQLGDLYAEVGDGREYGITPDAGVES